MDEQQVYVFNQYYIDFLKKIKPLAKEQKEKKSEARRIVKSIRKNYPTMDKLTNDYVQFLDSADFWKVHAALENATTYSDDFLKQNIYIDITVGDIFAIATDKHLLYYYVNLLDIFHTPELPLTEVLAAIKVISVPADFEEAMKAIENEDASKKLRTLHDMHTKNLFEDELKQIENTSLGKLAKEIMGDIDVEELKASMNDPNMNIFESLQNPNSGFGKVLGNVSKTMLSKLSSGELQKETLLKDAIDLATKLPNMLPGGMPEGMGSQLGNIGEMLKNLQKINPTPYPTTGEGAECGVDMAEMMMNMMNMNKTQRKRATSHLAREEKKTKAANNLKKKLQKRRENNNVQKEVEKAHE